MEIASSVAPAGRVVLHRPWRAVGLTVAAALAVNLLLWGLAVSLLPIAPEFLPLASPLPTLLFTALGVLGGAGVFALLARVARRPVATFRAIAAVVLVLSFVPNILTLLNPASAPFGGVTPVSIGVLMVLHLAPALFSMFLLPALTSR
jgi:hypothetical protein